MSLTSRFKLENDVYRLLNLLSQIAWGSTLSVNWSRYLKAEHLWRTTLSETYRKNSDLNALLHCSIRVLQPVYNLVYLLTSPGFLSLWGPTQTKASHIFQHKNLKCTELTQRRTNIPSVAQFLWAPHQSNGDMEQSCTSLVPAQWCPTKHPPWNHPWNEEVSVWRYGSRDLQIQVHGFLYIQ